MREWIEIADAARDKNGKIVSLCVREWIEITHAFIPTTFICVSLCVREWIEISCVNGVLGVRISLPLREGVD